MSEIKSAELLDRLVAESRLTGIVAKERDQAQADKLAVLNELNEMRLRQPRATPDQIEALLVSARRGMKINVIKEVRSITGMTLKDAKDLVERVLSHTVTY